MLCLLSFSGLAQARAITYPGGWSLMSMNDYRGNALHLFYSPTATYSIGLDHEYMQGANAQIDAAQLNYLLKRWNMPDSQANANLNAGLGVAHDEDAVNPAAYAGLSLDWESRRYFTSYENRFLWAEDTEKFARHKARVGIAPYIGGYGDVHTWLMVQTDYDAGLKDSFSATPLVRLFKGTALVEAGYNLDGGILFNAMLTF
jgi:hypothetical protein